MTYITQKKLDELKEKLMYLETTKRKELSERIAEAKSKGDISENAELDVANEDRGFNEGEILKIKEIIKTAEIIDENASHDKVEIGATVEIDFDGENEIYHLVGTNDADIDENKISNESSMGKQLIGHVVGDEFEINLPAGKFPIRIISIK